MRSNDVALKQVLASSAWKQLEHYLEWQRSEDRKDEQANAKHHEALIMNGDPECEAVIAALEQGWMLGKGR